MKKINGYVVPISVVIMLIITIINMSSGNAEKAVANVEGDVIEIKGDVKVIDERSNINKTDIAVLSSQFGDIKQGLKDIKELLEKK